MQAGATRMWQSVFCHDELCLLLVINGDDFKLAGPKDNLAKGWETTSSKVDIEEPEPYDRYFGCVHREPLNRGGAPADELLQRVHGPCPISRTGKPQFC